VGVQESKYLESHLIAWKWILKMLLGSPVRQKTPILPWGDYYRCPHALGYLKDYFLFSIKAGQG